MPRRRALINGLYVIFESRDPKLATVRWHPRFKQRYRTKADTQAAKVEWEEKGRIVWPEMFDGKRGEPQIRSSSSVQQQEMCL
jgi:hypothetical protein